MDEKHSTDEKRRHKHKHRDRSREREHKHKHKDHGSSHKHNHEDRDGEHKRRHKDSDHDRDDPGREHKKRRKRDDEGHKKHKRKDKLDVVDDDPKDDGWKDKDITMDGEHVVGTDIPTARSLELTSRADTRDTDPSLPHSTNTTSTLSRDEWMLLPKSDPVLPETAKGRLTSNDEDSYMENYGEESGGRRTLGGGVDFFSSLGTEKKKPPRQNKPDPEAIIVHSKELNTSIREGHQADETPKSAPATTPGDPGSQWRMMRLRRVYETAEEEGLPIEQVGIDRFGTLEAFEEAKEERRILDERSGKKPTSTSTPGDRRHGNERSAHYGTGGEKKLMFTDIGGSGSSSLSSSFRRPGGRPASGPSTPSPAEAPGRQPANRRLDSLRLPSQAGSPLAQSYTPIPSVMTPQLGSTSKSRRLSPSSLNKLQAKVIRAKLMNSADAAKLEEEYEAEMKKGQDVDERGVRTQVEVLPTLDGRGRMYDVGHGAEDAKPEGGNKRKKKEPYFETHDRKTGEVLRINADDDSITLGEMLRQERMGAGMSDQKDLDAQYARAIMGDGKFENDLDYIDDNAEKLGRQKMRSDAMKRQFAINDYKRTQQALASCSFCYGEDDSPPKAPVVAMGTRVYLSCTLTDELVKGHCLIVPIQHHLNMLEADDDVWDETRNFMKCLMKMFAEQDKGVVFYETVISLKKQKHTCIECVPVPWEQFDVLPGYFKESILASEAEWSQHKKLIDFSSRPGGFRRAMVPNLPYFMVQFDYKGEKGYGHVIEGGIGGEDEDGLEEGEKGGGEFPFYFAGEIIGNVLEIEARRWRRPRKVDSRRNSERVAETLKMYSKYDWTVSR